MRKTLTKALPNATTVCWMIITGGTRTFLLRLAIPSTRQLFRLRLRGSHFKARRQLVGRPTK